VLVVEVIKFTGISAWLGKLGVVGGWCWDDANTKA
jgi:hypothetical protein